MIRSTLQLAFNRNAGQCHFGAPIDRKPSTGIYSAQILQPINAEFGLRGKAASFSSLFRESSQ